MANYPPAWKVMFVAIRNVVSAVEDGLEDGERI